MGIPRRWIVVFCIMSLTGVFGGCATVPQTLNPSEFDFNSMGTTRLPVSAALVVPTTLAASQTSIKVECKGEREYLLPSGAEIAGGARRALSQTVLDLSLIKAASSGFGQFDLVINISPPVVTISEECEAPTRAWYVPRTITTVLFVLLPFRGLFPNPDEGKSTIAMDVGVKVTVMDRLGRTLLEDEYHGKRIETVAVRGGQPVQGFTVSDAFHTSLGQALKDLTWGVTASHKIKAYANAIAAKGGSTVASAADGAADVDDISNTTIQTSKNRHALVIGIERYRDGLPRADYADRDAVVMARYLTKVMGYPEENVAVLLNEKASLTDMAKYIENWLPNRVEQGDSVFVYYSGHGAPEVKTKTGYLVPYDGDPAFLTSTGYSLNRLYDRLGRLPAQDVVVVLDSCFSGAGGRSLIAQGARPLSLAIENPAVNSKQMTILTASSGVQTSSSYSEKGHGVFTYWLLKALQKDADSNGDGFVDLGEVYGYLKPRVENTARKLYNNEQTPQIVAPQGWEESNKYVLRQLAQ